MTIACESRVICLPPGKEYSQGQPAGSQAGPSHGFPMPIFSRLLLLSWRQCRSGEGAATLAVAKSFLATGSGLF